MPERLSRRMVLLAAYEDFTRKESVNLRDENLEVVLEMQGKKEKVIARLVELQDDVSAAEREDFNQRVAALLEQEKRNEIVLAEKLAANRKEYRRLSQNVVSANKFKRVYAAPIDRSEVKGSLKGRA